MKLEEYQTAKAALEAGAALVPGDSRFTKLIKECDERIAGSLHFITHLVQIMCSWFIVYELNVWFG